MKPDPRAASTAWPSRLLAVGAAVVLLAYGPDVFTRGDVLRGALFPFLAAVAAALGLRRPARDAGSGTAVLLLPVLVPLLGIAALAPPDAAGVLRHAAVWFGLAALAAGLSRVWAGPDDSARAWGWLVGAGAIAGVLTVVDAVARGARGAGPFGRPGIAGPVLAALLVATLLLPRVRRPWRAVALVGITAGLVAAWSRTGLLAGAVGVAAALALGGAGRRRWRWELGLGVLLLALAVAPVAVPGLVAAAAGDTVEVRVGLWRASADLVGERPTWGHGLGSFESEVLRVRDEREAAISRGRRPRVAHNDYLHVASEGGVGAGLALLLFVVGVLGLGWIQTRRRAPGVERRLLAASTGALLTVAVAALGEDVFLDPAPALVAAVAAASIVTLGLGSPHRKRRAGRIAVTWGLAFAGLAALLAAGVKTRDALSDRHLRAYQTTLLGGVDPIAAATGAQVHLREGALAWRGDQPEAWYRLGVHRMRFSGGDKARAAWRKALAADPGMTEARLDIARSYRAEGRLEQAREALLEARRHDPTRYDVHMRLGHLVLGPEPVPGETDPDGAIAIRALRHYNAAERLAPDRFEAWVARARVARRGGRLAEAGTFLREADAREPRAAETVLEAFRLEEVERVAHELVGVSFLTTALLKDPRVAGDVELEAGRLLAIGARREAAAKEAAAGTLTPPDFAAADRAYAAAARRVAGLLHARVRMAGGVLKEVEASEAAKAWRPALARLRAVLSWASFAPNELGDTQESRLHAHADLLLRTAQVAKRVDGDLSLYLYAKAHATQGAYLLELGEWAAARQVLDGAVEESPRDALVHLLHARALVGVGDLDAAEDALLAALLLDPSLKAEITKERAFAPLLKRADLAAALAQRPLR